MDRTPDIAHGSGLADQPPTAAGQTPGASATEHPRRTLRESFALAAGLAKSLSEQLKALEFSNTVILLGSMLLLAVLPYLILISTLLGRRGEADLARHIGLTRQGAQAISRLFESSSSPSATATGVAVAVAIAGTVGLGSALQVAYERVFRLPHGGRRPLARTLLWALLLCGALIAEGEASRTLRSAPVRPLAQGLAVLAGVSGFSLWSMHFLLGGRVPWRTLVAPALCTSVCWIGFDLVDSSYFSSAMVSDSRLYGAIGAVFDLATWFMAVGAVVVIGPVVAAAWRQRR